MSCLCLERSERNDNNNEKGVGVVRITKEEYRAVEDEYDRTFKEMNKKINIKMKEFIEELDRFIQFQLSSTSPECLEINSDDLIKEYNYLLQDKLQNDKKISKFDECYYHRPYKKKKNEN